MPKIQNKANADYPTRERCAKLDSLGFPNTAMAIQVLGVHGDVVCPADGVDGYSFVKGETWDPEENPCPAWKCPSVSEMLAFAKSNGVVNGKIAIFEEDDGFVVAYSYETAGLERGTVESVTCRFRADTFANAIADATAWRIRNGHVKTR